MMREVGTDCVRFLAQISEYLKWDVIANGPYW
jgi:hypothetical protein